jgi:hypothetical protein
MQEDFTDVGVTQPYQGHRRMTLTYPMINRARCRDVRRHRPRQVVGDGCPAPRRPEIPASGVTGERVVLMADAAAAGQARYQR